MPNNYKLAIEAISPSIDEDQARLAIRHMFYNRTPLYMEDPDLCDKIHDLMEQYGEDNDLSEGWWLEYVGEEDSVLFDIMDFKRSKTATCDQTTENTCY